MTTIPVNDVTCPAHQEHHRASAVALQQHVSVITARLETMNRRRQADEYRQLADRRSWLIVQLLPHVLDLSTGLSLLAVMRGDALTYGREFLQTMLLTNPSRYEESVRGLAVPNLLLLASVLESAGGVEPEAIGFVQRVQQLASVAHQQLVGQEYFW